MSQGGATQRARAENQEPGKTPKSYPKSGLGEGAKILQNATNTNQNAHWGGTGPDKNRVQSLVPGWAAGGKNQEGRGSGLGRRRKKQEHVWRVEVPGLAPRRKSGILSERDKVRGWAPARETRNILLVGWMGGREGRDVGG